jgi:glycosyltransferase involved in cell wall biosynthesis
MKILLIHNRYTQEGGEDRVVESETGMLRKFGHEVIYYERSNKELESLPFFKKVSFFLKDIQNSKRTYSEIISLVRENKPDIAHIHNIFFTITPSVYYALKEEGIPIVQSLHNYRFLCINGLFYRNRKVCSECTVSDFSPALSHKCFRNSFILSFFLKRCLDMYHRTKIFTKYINAYIALSQFSRSKFTSAGLPPEKVFVKPNFIEQPQDGKGARSDTAVFIGRLVDYKGITTLVRTYSSILKDRKLKVIGDGPLSAKLKRRYALAKNIEWLGSVRYPDVLEHIKTAAFLVFPSECYENMPRVIIEAFACGVPVMASDIGAVSEMVKPGFNGLLFKPGDSGDLAEKIEYLMQNNGLLEQMKANAYQEYKAKYSMEVNYNLLMDIYKKALLAKAGSHE